MTVLSVFPALSGPFPNDWAHYLAGGVLIGAGWGLCGVCPGPAIAGLGAGLWPLAWAVLGLLAGAWFHGLYASLSGRSS
ncbi:MAG: hypothetical protein KGL04_00045 [Elusimicrobia bacterium]|nr:hypothetical protein [Elusimicrobiota bacterium]